MNELWIASVIALWIVVLFMGLLLAGALRQLGILHMRLGDDPGALITDSGLDRGTQAPDFEARDAISGLVSRFTSLPPVARMVVFLSPNCLSCRELVPHLNEVRETRGKEFEFVTVCQGDEEGCRAFARMNRLKMPVFLDVGGEISHAYQVALTPFAYVLDFQGRVVIRGVVNDWRQLESLLDQEGTPEAGMTWSQVDAVNQNDRSAMSGGGGSHGKPDS